MRCKNCGVSYHSSWAFSLRKRGVPQDIDQEIGLCSMTCKEAQDGRAPMVTIGVFCYNHARFAGECLDSVAAQTYDDFELVVVDDASTDSSVAVIQEWIDAHPDIKCRLLVHPENTRLPQAINDAMLLARGRYIQLIAADDRLSPEKLRRQVTMLEADPATAFVYSDGWLIDEQGGRLDGTWNQRFGREFESDQRGAIFGELIQHGIFIALQSALIRTQTLREIGGADDRLFYEDWDILIRLAERGPAFKSDYIGFEYRLLDSSLSRSMPAWQTYMTTALTMAKHVRHDSAVRRVAERRMLAAAWGLWEERSSRRREVMWVALRSARSPMAVGVAILAALRVPMRLVLAGTRAASPRAASTPTSGQPSK